MQSQPANFQFCYSINKKEKYVKCAQKRNKGKNLKFLDYGNDQDKELAADLFASNMLLSPESYEMFIQKKDFSIEAICRYAESQNVMPYIVIGRLQKEKYLDYKMYSKYKLRYKWSDQMKCFCLKLLI